MAVIHRLNNRGRLLASAAAFALSAMFILAGCDEEKTGTVIKKDEAAQTTGADVAEQKTEQPVIVINDNESAATESADNKTTFVELYKNEGQPGDPSGTGTGKTDSPLPSFDMQGQSGDGQDGNAPDADAQDQNGQDPTIMDQTEQDQAGKDPDEPAQTAQVHADKSQIPLNMSWQYADHSKINSGSAVFYKASGNRKGITVGVNAGHGTKGGTSVKTLCHPDGSPKVTGGSTSAGSKEAHAVSSGMTFNDGATEASVNLKMARCLRDELLARGYDVLMIRDGDDVQLDNVARTVMCNNNADCHIAIHWDGDGLDYDKGCFYMSVPDALKGMEPVSSHWQQHERLGDSLIRGLKEDGFKIHNGGSMDIDLTQTSYSTVPSVDIELGNKASDHSDANLKALAVSLADGVGYFFGK